jgi:hypothetical protein
MFSPTTFVSTCSVQLYIRLNMFSPTARSSQHVQSSCTFVSTCSVQLYIRLNMFSPNVYSSQHVQSNCTFVSTCSVQLHTLCNVMYSYISSPVFSRRTPFTLLLHQTVWQLCRQEALATAVSVQFKYIATLNCVCLYAILQYLPVPL